MEKTNLSKLFLPFIYVAIFCLYYMLFLNQGLMRPGPLGNFLSDTSSHIMHDLTATISANYYLHQNWLELLALDAEPLLHVMTAFFAMLIHLISGGDEKLDLINAMALILSAAKLSEFIITKKILDSNVQLSEYQSVFVTFIINFCTVLYLPIVNLNIYLPIFSPNVLHNPTMILLTPLAVAFFYWYIKLYIQADVATYKYSVLFSLLLITATLVKPAFTSVMLLVMASYYLTHPKRFVSKYLAQDMLIYAPSACIILFQIYLISKSSLGVIAFSPYKVISYYTQHPIITLLQAIEFPLLITLIYIMCADNKNAIYLWFSWVFALIAYVIWSLFYLAGPTWTHANLAWPYSLSLTFLYVFSIVAFVSLLVNDQYKDKIRHFLINLGSINLGLIFFSGANQFITVYLGGSWY